MFRRKIRPYVSRLNRKLTLRFIFLVCLFVVVKYFIDYITQEIYLPHVIWMLWDSGWQNAPKLQLSCRKSWVRKNPDFLITSLDLTEAERLINRRQYYKEDAWNTASIQAKSDIIRIEILAAFGGIWIDSTVRCNAPLSSWIKEATAPAHFFTYERRDSDVTADQIPHISSWFIAATNSSYIIQRLRNDVRKKWSYKPYPPQKLGYYWLHRIFRDLTRNDIDFYNEYNKMPFKDAAGPHCFTFENSYVHKMTSDACIKRYALEGQ